MKLPNEFSEFGSLTQRLVEGTRLVQSKAWMSVLPYSCCLHVQQYGTETRRKPMKGAL